MQDGDKRVIIEKVKPEIDCGKYPVKRVINENMEVEADIYTDGHDVIGANLLYKTTKAKKWNRVPMTFLVNDRWKASFTIMELTDFQYTIEAWIDPFETWLRDFIKKVKAGVATDIDVLFGAELIKKSQQQAPKKESKKFQQYIDILENKKLDLTERTNEALSANLATLLAKYPLQNGIVKYEKDLTIIVDRKKALFSAWYEFFPRSSSFDESRHGTFKDMLKVVPYIADMGFDVLYLPPIHPIGITNRKGKNNALKATPDDLGSPWAIGSPDGGHKSINPKLGNENDFKKLVKEAEKHNIEIALDIAFQCSPDHPWVKSNPEWFTRRPDGSIQFAENPPKKYEDIYPLNFESPSYKSLWEELKSVFDHWINFGVKIFRVDNPHTKPFRFWQWVIGEIRKDHPEVLFLAEAFTRPKVMNQLAKGGFNQSYTYFAWRNAKWELTQYMTELTKDEPVDFFRPNFWPNTPDILTEYLQTGGRQAFITRLVLAATMSSNYGIYGPAFELAEGRAREFGSEEYLNSEKYQIREWNLKDPESLEDIITTVNRIRKENPALHTFKNIKFHTVENDNLIAYTKSSDDNKNIILTVVNLDPYHTQSGWMRLPLEVLNLDEGSRSYQVYDMLGESWYIWHDEWNYVELNPHILPAHVFKIRKKVRTEQDFDYYL
jgi:starch synthase (maltosyl-transferring)